MELHFACVFIRESESVYHLSADRLTEKKNSLSIIIYYRFEKRVIMMRFDIFWADPVSATPHKIDFSFFDFGGPLCCERQSLPLVQFNQKLSFVHISKK